MFQELNTYKNNLLFSAFLMTTFIFPLIGNISTADALGNYGCYDEEKNTHVRCLRSLLDSTQYGGTVPRSDGGLGNYGCYNEDKKTHVDCLRALLDQHGPYLAKGANTPHQLPPGTHPPCPPGTNCGPTPNAVTMAPPCPPGTNCDPIPSAGTMALNVEHPCYNVPPAERNGHACWNNATQEGQGGLNARITQLEIDLGTAYDGQASLNARIAQLEAELTASNAAQAPLNARIAELEKQLSDAREVHRISVERYEQSDRALRADLAAANAAQEPLNARIAQLEAELSASNSAQEPLNARIAQLEAELSNSAQAPMVTNRENQQLANPIETPIASQPNQPQSESSQPSSSSRLEEILERVQQRSQDLPDDIRSRELQRELEREAERCGRHRHRDDECIEILKKLEEIDPGRRERESARAEASRQEYRECYDSYAQGNNTVWSQGRCYDCDQAENSESNNCRKPRHATFCQARGMVWSNGSCFDCNEEFWRDRPVCENGNPIDNCTRQGKTWNDRNVGYGGTPRRLIFYGICE